MDAEIYIVATVGAILVTLNLWFTLNPWLRKRTKRRRVRH